MSRILRGVLILACSAWMSGCATQKESHTPRTGVEQLLVSSAVDQSLNGVDYSSLQGKQVYVEGKYLDCVDKNYVLLALRSRVLGNRGSIVEKPEAADVIVEVSSGGVGTDGQELFVGIPEIMLPPPFPMAIPRLSILTRKKMNGTAKLLVVAYNAKSRAPLMYAGATLARSDQNNWNVLGLGPVQTGSVSRDLAATESSIDLSVTGVIHYVTETLQPSAPPTSLATTPPNEPIVRAALGPPVAREVVRPTILQADEFGKSR